MNFSILSFCFGILVRSEIFPVYTPAAAAPGLPGTTITCGGDFQFAEDLYEGHDGRGLDAPAFAIATGDGSARVSTICNQYYKLTNQVDERFGFIVVAAHEETASVDLEVGPALCEALCNTATCDGNVTCELAVEAVVPTLVYTSVETALPEEASTACDDPTIDWTTSEGGDGSDHEVPAYAILVEDGLALEEADCLVVYELFGDVEDVSVFVVIAANADNTPTALAVSSATCDVLCQETCNPTANAPCAISAAKYEITATTEEVGPETTEEVGETTEEVGPETTEDPTTAEPATTETTTATIADGAIEVSLWNGSCEEVTCGSVDWDSQTLCGSKLLPCFAKVEGALTLVDEIEDSEKIGQEIEVECGHVLAIEGQYVHVISIDAESSANTLRISDTNFLGLCPLVCKDTGLCSSSALTCGADGAYTDCSCPDDAADALCQDCDEECSEFITGSARGALENNISIFVEAVVVEKEAVGSAQKCGIAAGFAASVLMLV